MYKCEVTALLTAGYSEFKHIVNLLSKIFSVEGLHSEISDVV
jgi:hypothetical protein